MKTIGLKHSFIYALIRERRNVLYDSGILKDRNNWFYFPVKKIVEMFGGTIQSVRYSIKILEEIEYVYTKLNSQNNEKYYQINDELFLSDMEKYRSYADLSMYEDQITDLESFLKNS